MTDSIHTPHPTPEQDLEAARAEKLDHFLRTPTHIDPLETLLRFVARIQFQQIGAAQPSLKQLAELERLRQRATSTHTT